MALTAAALVAAPLLSGCAGSGTDTSPSPSGTVPGGPTGSTGGTTGTPGNITGVPDATTGTPRHPAGAPPCPRSSSQVRTAVYFLHSGKLSPAPRSVSPPSTAASALRALLAGPDGYERAHGRSTAIPSGTTLRSIAVRAHVATVDLSGRYDDGGGSASMKARLAQVVFTATRFPGIDKVRFELDGTPVTALGGEGVVLNHPVGRADFEDVTPAVLVESPLIGGTAHSPVRVWGTANTFEAVFRLRLTDATGRVAADVRVKATSGTGTRGTFDVTVPYRAARTGAGTLTAYVNSPKDGAPSTVETVPLILTR
ncbi:Gmad2 immunoglobulin-like domain-containing protein [Actinacidiphila alni]|uniref:GerMN domain-containing protein n=1 Tax=Actinacidiphila alni TaxID=380248 RepID=UPI0033D492C6